MAKNLLPADIEKVALYGAVAFGIWVLVRGLGTAAQDLSSGAVDVVTGAASGFVGAVGEAVGLPAPWDTTTNPRVARWIIDSPYGGELLASAWSSAGAFFQAQFLNESDGIAPTPGTKIAARFYII